MFFEHKTLAIYQLGDNESRKAQGSSKKRAEAAAAIYDDGRLTAEESQETGASMVQVPGSISRPTGVKETKKMSNALLVKREANEKLEFLEKVLQRKAVVVETALVIAQMRERRECFSSEGVSAQARSKCLGLTEKMLADFEEDLEEEVGSAPTEGAYYVDDSTSAEALIRNGEEFITPDDEDLLSTGKSQFNVSLSYNGKPRA